MRMRLRDWLVVPSLLQQRERFLRAPQRLLENVLRSLSSVAFFQAFQTARAAPRPMAMVFLFRNSDSASPVLPTWIPQTVASATGPLSRRHTSRRSEQEEASCTESQELLASERPSGSTGPPRARASSMPETRKLPPQPRGCSGSGSCSSIPRSCRPAP